MTETQEVKRGVKSTVTCDMEGIIETFNEGAETLFGYTKEEVIGRKRVSLFSPGLIVLQNVPKWLKDASEQGEMSTQTVFVRKDGSVFSAQVRITPTFKSNVQVGYCGVTEEITEIVKPQIKFTTRMVKWLVILRAPFLTASIFPALIAGAFVHTTGAVASFPTGNFLLALFGVMLLHLASNVINDYFDWTNGTDPENNNYFVQYSGGSRAVELGLITVRGTLMVATTLFATSALIGVYLWQQMGGEVLVLGMTGAFLGYFYTAPPVRLVARHGLGELAIGAAFGPLLTGGVTAVCTGHASLMSFLVGVPIGLLVTNILLINQVPDRVSDARTGKNHLVVTWGDKASVGIYAAIALVGLAVTVWLAGALAKPMLYGVAAVYGGYGAWTWNWFRTHLGQRSMVKANVNTINLAITVGALTALAIWL
jgi:1,4-dihydroxy-2-naphthoate octaprenyltransferase